MTMPLSLQALGAYVFMVLWWLLGRFKEPIHTYLHGAFLG